MIQNNFLPPITTDKLLNKSYDVVKAVYLMLPELTALTKDERIKFIQDNWSTITELLQQVALFEKVSASVHDIRDFLNNKAEVVNALAEHKVTNTEAQALFDKLNQAKKDLEDTLPKMESITPHLDTLARIASVAPVLGVIASSNEAIEKVSNHVSELTTVAGNIQTLVDGSRASNELSTQLEKVSLMLREIQAKGSEWNQQKRALEQLKEETQEKARVVESNYQQALSLQGSLNQLSRDTLVNKEAAVAAATNAQQYASQANAAIGTVERAKQDLETNFQSLNAQLQGNVAKGNALLETQQEMANSISRVKSEIDTTLSTASIALEKAEIINTDLDKTKKAIETYNQEATVLNNSLKVFKNQLDQDSITFSKIRASAEEATVVTKQNATTAEQYAQSASASAAEAKLAASNAAIGQIQANWNEENSSEKSYIRNKPKLGSLSKKDFLDWEELTGKPVKFIPVAHTHEKEAIQGTGKYWSSNTIPASDISGTKKYWTTDTIPYQDITDTPEEITWDTLKNKPSKFIPATHTHKFSELTDKEVFTIKWSQVESTPSFALSVHTHKVADISDIRKYGTKATVEWGDITGVPEFTTSWDTLKNKPDLSVYFKKSDLRKYGTVDKVAYSDVTGVPTSIAWSNVTGKPTFDWQTLSGKPSTFTPSNHTHTVSNISDLESYVGEKVSPIQKQYSSLSSQVTSVTQAVSEKANKNHTHTASQITGIEESLSGIAHEADILSAFDKFILANRQGEVGRVSPSFVDDLALKIKEVLRTHAIGETWISYHGIPAGGIPFNGTSITKSSYPDFYAWLKKKNLLVPFSEYTKDIQKNNGNTVLYGEEILSSEVRIHMPNITTYLKVAGMSGEYTKEGLPNITGDLGLRKADGTKKFPSGAFEIIPGQDSYAGYTNNSTLAGGVRMDASKSNPIYGASEHVTPETMTVLMGVYALSSVKSTASVNADELLAQAQSLIDELQQVKGSIGFVEKNGNRGSIAGYEEVKKLSGDRVSLTKDSADTSYWDTSGKCTLVFLPAEQYESAVKVIHLRSQIPGTTLELSGATWVGGEPPAWGKPDNHLTLSALYLAGRTYVSVVYNSEDV